MGSSTWFPFFGNTEWKTVRRPHFYTFLPPHLMCVEQQRRVTPWLRAALFLHRVFIPQTHKVPIGVVHLCSVSPRQFLRRVLELNTAGGKLPIFGFDVIHLKSQDAGRCDWLAGAFPDENSEPAFVLEGYSLEMRNFKLDRKTQISHVPVLRTVNVAHEYSEMVQFRHCELFPASVPLRLAFITACHGVQNLGIPGLLEILEGLSAHCRIDVRVRRSDDGAQFFQHEEDDAVMDHSAKSGVTYPREPIICRLVSS